MNHTMRNRMKSGLGILLPFGLLILFMAGCGLTQKEIRAKDQVASANKAYAEAKANPDVQAYAPIELQDAGNAVQALAKVEETDDKLQQGYLAERKAQYAVTVAEGKATERNLDKLRVETAELNARKQTLEAERAAREADRARQDADRARQEADKATLEAEQARAAGAADAEKAAVSKRLAQAEAEKAAVSKRLAQAEAEKSAKAKVEAEALKKNLQAEAEKSAKAKMEAARAAESAAKAKAESEEFMKELADLKAQQTERGIVLTIGDVLFASGKANLSPDANKSVDKVAVFLKKYPNRSLLIEGHTDSVGRDDYNLELSRKRADSVKTNLVVSGTEAGRITTVGYGRKFPVAGNDTTVGRSQNRRVEVIILNEGVKAETQFRK